MGECERGSPRKLLPTGLAARAQTQTQTQAQTKLIRCLVINCNFIEETTPLLHMTYDYKTRCPMAC